MTRDELLWFLRRHKLAVEASVGPGGRPQAAVVGFGVSDQLEIVFDTVNTTRKYRNLLADPRIALVIGWDEAVTVQIEGLADFPEGPELERLKAAYFTAYPEGRERLGWPGITYVRVRAHWARHSDFTVEPARIEELTLD
ncbi:MULTISPECIES: pyridoxamine 5'-phosphate oxidase family protein [unclassified Streptomyces]|uniref:pyridoxamine 5'-phosphate oxidase family protein n=1 Tax=unclassified Streptomyces TaxID=2593676 RepID=UPI0028C4422B|nr:MULTISPECIES: pyridoxamine 5'-phosphate oxidase family protein [unclassified Streptomyces]WNO73911.1 pyridoxamine 5'-phosphate oxidase family protein [Streptomyces sp. AM8-1-1]